MDLTRRDVLGAVSIATVGLAGCTDGGGGGERMTDATESPTDAPDSTDSSDSTDTPDSTDPSTDATVAVRDHPDLGEILVGPTGMTLYMFDQDTQGSGESSCTESCLENWPPLTVDGDASAGSDVTAELSTFDRGDGETQVAADGWPLYYFTPDGEPGDANGQGANDVWWVLRPDGSVVRDDETDTATETDGRY